MIHLVRRILSVWVILMLFSVFAEARVPIVLWGNTDLRLLSYEWNNSGENELGITGTLLDSFVMGDSNNTIYSKFDRMLAATQVGYPLGINYFALRIDFGYITPNWSATTWIDPNEWSNAIRSVEDVARLADQVGAKIIILDVEKYDHGLSYNDYLFTRGGSEQLAKAYDRGVEVANAIASVDMGIAVMMIPEVGAASFWIGGSVGRWESFNWFRNGLLEAEPHIQVWVGLGGTYGDGGQKNDNEIMLRVNGVKTGFTDPNVYKAAAISYIQDVKADLRSTSGDPNAWDEYGGVAPAISVLGTWSDREGKRSSWYTPELFEAQLTAFETTGAKIIWEWTWRFPWKQWTNAEIEAAGLQVGGTPDTNPDYWTSWYSALPTHPNINEYIAVIRDHAKKVTRLDLDGNGRVDFLDFAIFASKWGQCTAPECD